VSDAAALDAVLDRLPPASKPARFRTVDRLYSIVVGGDSDRVGVRRMNLLYADIVRLARLTRFEHVLQAFESNVELAVAELARGWVFVHAAVVELGGAAALIPGRSGSGKTTLARELVRAGGTLYSDEFAVLDARGRVHPFRRRSTEDAAGAPLRVGLVLATEYRAGAPWRPRAASRAESVLALLANAVAIRREPARVIAALERATAGSVGLEGVRGEAAEAAALVRAAMRD
jgi:hypothetical protein